MEEYLLDEIVGGRFKRRPLGKTGIGRVIPTDGRVGG
jgi:hypothetical protein